MNMDVNKIFDLFSGGREGDGDYTQQEYFERGWEFISQCEIDKEEWQQCLILYNDEEIKVALRLSINFFQELEEYEKCAYLKKILDFCEKSLAVPE